MTKIMMVASELMIEVLRIEEYGVGEESNYGNYDEKDD